MPELPEVETVRATLEKRIIGETICDVTVLCERIIENVDQDIFKGCLVNQTFRAIKRYGKYLFFILDDVTIISHLRMEGKYFLKKSSDPIEKHEHVIFTMKSGMSIRYHDTRKFGTMRIAHTTKYDELLKETEIAHLGKEAIDETYSSIELYNKLIKKRVPIKVALLDQEIICGLGNIYVDEVLFASALNPEMEACNVTLFECDEILSSSRKILKLAIKEGGTTIRSYTSSLGVTGRFQINLKVHTLDGKSCSLCGTTILKTRVGGRGTYYCPTCQKQYPLVVGITGGIATGKSVVSAYIKNKGFQVVDADEIAKSITISNQEVINQIKNVFGEEFVYNNKIDRKKLGKLIFNNHDEAVKLNQIIHPIVRDIIISKIKESNEKIIFLDIPLLFEARMDDLCNEIICVCSSSEKQLAYLVQRDKIDTEYAMKKIASQMPLDEKAKRSTYIIDNSSELCYTYNQIEEIIEKIKKRVQI